MSFRSFLGGAARVILGWIGAGIFILLSGGLMMDGYTLLGGGAFVIALVCLLYSEYHRGRQPQRMRGGNTYR